MKRLQRVVALSFVAASALAACSSSDEVEPVPTSNSAPTAPASDAGGKAPVRVGKVLARVQYAGAAEGSLSVGVFAENPPMTKPPVAFATTKAPVFPFDAELRGVEPGKYWVIAVLDRPPLSSGTLRPGPEDVQGASAQFEVLGDDTVEVDVDLGGADAGATDAASD
jgi:hypothetical protein